MSTQKKFITSVSSVSRTETGFYISVVNSSRRNVLKEGWDSVSAILYVSGMYVGGMYVVCNHVPGPSVLGGPDHRSTETFSCQESTS
jgi:hypothetical protein